MRAEELVGVLGVEGEQVCCLAALDVDDAEALASFRTALQPVRAGIGSWCYPSDLSSQLAFGLPPALSTATTLGFHSSASTNFFTCAAISLKGATQTSPRSCMSRVASRRAPRAATGGPRCSGAAARDPEAAVPVGRLELGAVDLLGDLEPGSA